MKTQMLKTTLWQETPQKLISKFTFTTICILLIILIFPNNKCNANNFDLENIYWGANIAWVTPIGDFNEHAKGGIGGNTLIGYKLTEKLGLGIELGGAATGAFDESMNSGFFGLNFYGLQSLLVKSMYRFSTETFRPYVGVGAGLAKVAEPTVIIGTEEIEGASRFGLGANAELGLNIKGFNMAYSFNLSGKAPKDGLFNPNANDLTVNFHRITMGYIRNF